MASNANRFGQGEHVALSRILPAGVLAIVLAVVANLIVQFIGVRVVDVSPQFPALASPVPIILFTAIGVALAVVVFAVIARRSARPYALFQRVALVCLVLSLVPNVLILVNQGSTPGASTGAIVILMIMHVVAYLIVVGVLATRTRAS
jgi:uncharacterized membrane protein